MTIQKFINQISTVLDQLGIPYIITGGIAVSIWGRPRHTADVDLVIEVNSIKSVHDLILELKKAIPNSYPDEDLALDAYYRKSEFNLIESEYGLKADFFISSGEEFKKSEMKRGRTQDIDGKMIRFVSPEDLIISKLIWFRLGQSTRQLEDIKSVMDIQQNLDHEYLDIWVNRLKLQSQWQVLKQLLDKN